MPELNNDDPSTLIKRSGELTTELFLAALVLCRASLRLIYQGMSQLRDSKWELSVSAAGPVPAAGDRLGFSLKLGENVTTVLVEEFLASGEVSSSREAEQPSSAGFVHANLPHREPKARGQHPGFSNHLGASSTAPASALQENLSLSPHSRLLGVSSCCIWC